MKALHGTAIYTGGGIYVCIGQMDNGLWFVGTEDGCDLYDADVRQDDEEYDVVFANWDWCEKHMVEISQQKQIEVIDAFEDFCKRLDAKEPGLTDGYEEFSNYSYEVWEMIDFSYFDCTGNRY